MLSAGLTKKKGVCQNFKIWVRSICLLWVKIKVFMGKM